jgi:hypothetical protein
MPGPTIQPLIFSRYVPELLDRDILEDTFSSGKNNQPYILDLVNLEKLFFQTIPLTLKYSPDTSWVAIASAARNTPVYQYVGAEDSIAFTLSWYCNHDSYLDVLKKCKWLESLSKSDGYAEKPHLVQFAFGELFRDSKWLVKSAPYEFSLFDREQGMLPKLATQEVTLVRLQETNRRRTEILKFNT